MSEINTFISQIQELPEAEDLKLHYKLLEGDARIRIKDLNDKSVQLIVTSPPYGSIKNYTNKNDQIGWDQDYLNYHHSLMDVFRECVRVLSPGCRMVINIGDEFVQTTNKKPYHIIPHASQIISNIVNEFPDTMMFNGCIHWQKVTTSNTSGGGKIMGSVYHPRNGHFFINYEHIMVFKKIGKAKRPESWRKEQSRFTLEERREWFSDTWVFSPERQDEHIAMFPLILPERLIRMYSFVGDVVLDPFAGSGTTLAAAAKHARSAIGIELGFGEGENWKKIISHKIQPYLNEDFELEFSSSEL